MTDSPIWSPGKAVTVDGLESNAKGLTLASYLKDPGQLLPETVGLLGISPVEEEEENVGVFEGSEGMGAEEGGSSQGL